MKKYNLNELPKEAIQEFGGFAVTQELGEIAGSEKIYANIDILPPGAYSAKFHAHSMQEEFFLIMEGTGILRTNEGEQPVQRGDFIAKPAGLDSPHTFYNNSDLPLKILDVGTKEAADVAYYPDDDIYFLRGKMGGKFLNGKLLDGFSTDPNE